jgi:hypothetical protein
MTGLDFRKFSPIDHEVVITDGVWGSGKSLLAPLVNTYEGVQMVRLDHVLEHLVVLQRSGKIASDAAKAMTKSHLGELFYSNLIGRNLNFRWSDDSGLRGNPNKIKSVLRMLGPEGDGVLKKGLNSRESLHLMTHNLLLCSDLVQSNISGNLKFIEMIRNPLDVFHNWMAYLSRFEGMREATLSFDYKGNKLPWFVDEFKEGYITGTLEERAVICLVEVYTKLLIRVEALDFGAENFLILEFEDVELETDSVLVRLEQFLGRRTTRFTNRVCKKLGLPRSQGHGLDVTSHHSKFHRRRVLDDLHQILSLQLFAELEKTLMKYDKWQSSRKN